MKDYKQILKEYEEKDKKFGRKLNYALASAVVSGSLLIGLQAYAILNSKPVTETRKTEIYRLEKAIDNCFNKQDSIDESVRKSLKQCYLETK